MQYADIVTREEHVRRGEEDFIMRIFKNETRLLVQVSLTRCIKMIGRRQVSLHD